MKKIPVGTKVQVKGSANQFPFERVVDKGIVLDNTHGYLVELERNRENLVFRRKDLVWKQKSS